MMVTLTGQGQDVLPGIDVWLRCAAVCGEMAVEVSTR